MSDILPVMTDKTKFPRRTKAEVWGLRAALKDLIAPYVRDASSPLPTRLISIGYPVGDLLVLCVMVRLAVGVVDLCAQVAPFLYVG